MDKGNWMLNEPSDCSEENASSCFYEQTEVSLYFIGLLVDEMLGCAIID